MSGPRHFLDLNELSSETLRSILDRGVALKSAGTRSREKPHAGRVLAMIFEKPSTRTRASFDVAMFQLGGHAVGLSSEETQIGRGETVADTARVLSRYVDAIMIRAGAHRRLLDLAANADVPVINGLTDFSHPCQLLADVMTFEQHRGAIAGRVVAWSGDGNNVATSWIHAAVRFGFELRLACPPSRSPDAALLAWAADEGGAVTLTDDAAQAAAGADCVVTDTWVSMGDKDSDAIKTLLAPYRVDAALMAAATPDALFMHCLPAHRGDEVTAEVIDGPHSVVWDGAENRLHAQKGILDWCFGG